MDGPLNALSPNTAAFLDSITFNTNDMDKLQQQQHQPPTSMPPSAFFPVPGRDTPEDSSPDSIVADPKPHQLRKSLSLSDSDDDMNSLSNHKRKAQGHGQQHEEEDEGGESLQ